jgi:type III pantothenate kinase
MLAGSVLGTAVLIDGLAQRVEQELGRPVTLVVTGGLARYVTPLCRHELTYDPELLMKGLAYLYRLNAPQNGAQPKPRGGSETARPAEKASNAAHPRRRPNRGRHGRPHAAHREDESNKSA